MQWFYTTNGEKNGPVEYSDIQRLIADGTLSGTDYLWNETMGKEWSLLSSLQEFTENIPVPPLPGVIAAIQQEVQPHTQHLHLKGNISCTAVVRPAWERMKDILFRPFNLSKWFTLGVSAWLATLGDGGSSYSSGRNSFGNNDNITGDNFSQGIAYIKDFWLTYSNYIITGAIIITMIIIAASLLVAWLKARGKFMLLDNVVKNSAEITAPWIEFKQHGKSLFLWYIFFSIINMLVFLIIGSVGFLSIALPCINASAFAPAAIPGIVAVSLLALLYMIIAGYIGRFVEDFIIPIMYNFDMTITEAWNKFRNIFEQNSGALLIYGLFYLILGMLSGLAILTFAIATCCIGACLMIIPFIGTVTLLPITIFFRAYSLEYLAQFGDEYICFEDEK